MLGGNIRHVVLRADYLMTPMSEALHLEEDTAGTLADHMLSERGYTAAPVVADGEIIGVYVRGDADGGSLVREGMEPLGLSNVVTADADLPTLLHTLSSSYMALVLFGNQIVGFITPSDLWVPPTRAYIYAILTSIESNLADFVRARNLTEECIDGRLGRERRRKRHDLKKQLVEDDIFVDDASTMSISDLIAVSKRETDFSNALQAEGVGLQRLQRGIVHLRNDVMHPSRPLVGVGKDGLVGEMRARIENLSTLARISANALTACRHLSCSPYPKASQT